MMIGQMRDINFINKTVLDFGTGTGVLAILSEKLGAKKVVAIDNDDWSIENPTENFQRNDCSLIDLKKADTAATNELYDIITANVNKNVILENIPFLAKQLSAGGVLLLSGLLKEDRDVVFHICIEYSLQLIQTTVRDNWLCLRISC
jgi:ribosomal protein L11 methyltransferase